MIGSVVGAIIGAVIGVPVPVVGSLLAALLFGGLGAAAGAMFGEWSSGREWKQNVRVGHSTFWGRTFGTIGKTMVGLVILVVVVAAMVV